MESSSAPGRDGNPPIVLKPLDPRFERLTAPGDDGPLVAHLERFIRHRRAAVGRALPKSAVIQLFDHEARELADDTKIAKGTTSVWYRVWEGSRSIGRWKFSWQSDRRDGHLDALLHADILAAIRAGKTVGALKRVVAEFLGIYDANRIVVVARDGLRRGVLQGTQWQVRQITTWLCHWLSFGVVEEKGYVVLRGMRREFVWYPLPSKARRPIPLGEVSTYLARAVLCHVHRYDRSELDRQFEVSLSLDGKPLDVSQETVRWGATYDFGVPYDAAETFCREESWLLAPAARCTVCMERKKLSDMPIRTTSRCKHHPAICRDCYQSWLQSQIERGAWDRLKCSQCPELLEWRDVKRNVDDETFARYDTLVLRGVLSREPTFQFCLSAACESGQMHDQRCPKFDCAECSGQYCVEHNVPWHSGETCEEYDRRNSQRKQEKDASHQTIQESTKRCPGCQRDIHKYLGCNHITCVCGHEWCYICLAPQYSSREGLSICQHAPGCSELNARRDGIRAVYRTFTRRLLDRLQRLEGGEDDGDDGQDERGGPLVPAIAPRAPELAPPGNSDSGPEADDHEPDSQPFEPRLRGGYGVWPEIEVPLPPQPRRSEAAREPQPWAHPDHDPTLDPLLAVSDAPSRQASWTASEGLVEKATDLMPILRTRPSCASFSRVQDQPQHQSQSNSEKGRRTIRRRRPWRLWIGSKGGRSG